MGRALQLPVPVLLLVLTLAPRSALAKQRDSTQQPAESSAGLRRLSLEQLMDVEVTSVSRRAEPLAHTASAIQVITAEDIARSGATTLPEALRLAGNLQVTQVD